MTLTVFRALLSTNKTFFSNDMGRHFPPVSLGGDDSIHTLGGTSESGRQSGLSTLLSIKSHVNLSLPFL